MSDAYASRLLGGEGLLGTGNANSSETPVVVPGLPPIRSISCGAFHSVALSCDGRVFSWGKGANGRLGLGGNSDQNKPACISDFDGMEISSVSCGDEHSGAVVGGSVFCWGKNRHGELGMESYNIHAQESSPTPVHDLLDDTMCSIPRIFPRFFVPIHLPSGPHLRRSELWLLAGPSTA